MVTGVDDLFVGRYELDEVLGSGGTGVVRRARDTVLDRPVALKLLRPGSGDEVVRARLRAEARLAGALVHPGVAQVYDYGEDASGDEPAPYIVMQYVEGTSLWHVLRERRTLPADEVMDLVAQTASALEAAHAAGIVHRDLKPSNILVTDEGRAVLVDFGIARTLDSEPLTATGTVDRDRRLHQPGADRRPDRHAPVRHLLARDGRLRVPVRAQAVPSGVDGRDGARPPAGRGARAGRRGARPAYALSSHG